MRTFINAKLRQYKYHVRFEMPNVGEFEDEKGVKVFLLITDDILVETVPAIDKQVLSMHFESDVDNLVHVSCCQAVGVWGSAQTAHLKTDKVQTDSVNNNNSAISLALNSHQRSPLRIIGLVFLFLMVFADGSLVTSVVYEFIL